MARTHQGGLKMDTIKKDYYHIEGLGDLIMTEEESNELSWILSCAAVKYVRESKDESIPGSTRRSVERLIDELTDMQLSLWKQQKYYKEAHGYEA